MTGTGYIFPAFGPLELNARNIGECDFFFLSEIQGCHFIFTA